MSAIEQALREAVAAELAPVTEELRALRLEVQQLRETKPAPPDPDQRFLLPEAAVLAKKHPDTLRRAIKAKKLKGSKPDGGREWVIRRGDLNDYLAGRRPGLKAVDENRKIEDAVARARKAG